MRRRIFTKWFYDLSIIDQVQTVDARINEAELAGTSQNMTVQFGHGLLLEEAGHQQTSATCQQPVVISRNLLAGPFSFRPSGNYWELLNGDGHVFAWEVGDESVPRFTVELMNLAYRKGKIPSSKGRSVEDAQH
jgi:hypothetical protein